MKNFDFRRKAFHIPEPIDHFSKNPIFFANLLLAWFTLCTTGHAMETEPGPLAEYVARPDASYGWSKRQEGRIEVTDYTELTLTSQTWRGIVWKHRLFIIRPSTLRPDIGHGLLFIAGGRWEDDVEQNDLPRKVHWLAGVAEQLRSHLVVLFNVPRQPMFGDRYEDEIVSLTFHEYLETGDAEWPLLLPMVKSAVRAMDAAGQYAHEAWHSTIDTYTATGVSKRGWTTWLLGAVDPRVTAIAPMAIDVLNMPRQMDHQRRAWGDVSYKIGDYTERGLVDRIKTPKGKALLSIVDPYHYRHLLNQPKLIVIGTNDHYWPLDALNLYWDDLAGDKYILYVPNNQHDLKDSSRLIGSLDALHQHAATGRPLPKLSWEFAMGDGGLSLRMNSDLPTHEVRAWVATSPGRDFREARWESFPARRHGGRSVYELTVPSTGFAAMFGEAEYHGDSLPYYLSTNVRVVGSKPVGNETP
uniref:PhoPQ-activated pathogenicity-related protein n=1 Tax=Candidatus Kentrum sp. LFY TaxID=2126342 RepID=A0A450UWA6_9GAMM|nr:MAG: PhoPQ-activated pathogenicity-related protein [Candidatus Kentron sp. LFY]